MAATQRVVSDMKEFTGGGAQRRRSARSADRSEASWTLDFYGLYYFNGPAGLLVSRRWTYQHSLSIEKNRIIGHPIAEMSPRIREVRSSPH